MQQAMNTITNLKMFKRYQVIYLYLKLYKHKEIADFTGIPKSTVNQYIMAYIKKRF